MDRHEGAARYELAWHVIRARGGQSWPVIGDRGGADRLVASERTGLLSAGVASLMGGRGQERQGPASRSGLGRSGVVSHRGAESGELSRLGQARQIGVEWLGVDCHKGSACGG